jgi:hypothetical protein
MDKISLIKYTIIINKKVNIMQSPFNKILQIGFAIFVISILIVFTACSQDNKNPNQNTMHLSKGQIDSSIIRDGTIDLVMIDVNKNGKVFQDPMDWNVISDESGKCPLCGMKLKEISLEKAKENCIKNSFNVSDNKN